MGKVVRFPVEQVKCARGSVCFHPHYGTVTVVAAEGFKRVFAWQGRLMRVDVRELRSQDPIVDVRIQ